MTAGSLMLDLTNSRLTTETISNAILAIEGVTRYGGETEHMNAFKFPRGAMVLVMLIPGTLRRVTMRCTDPEEFGQLAVAMARLEMSG